MNLPTGRKILQRSVLASFSLLAILFTFRAECLAQYPDIIEGSIRYPRILDPGKVKMSLELTFARLPEDILLEFSQIRAPLFSFDVYYGLPHGFLLEGKWSTVLIFTNQFQVGAKWAHEWDRLHLSVGDDMAYVTGHLDQGAVKTFDNSIKAWFNYPNLAVGYAFDKFSLTLRGELNISTSIRAYSDEIELSSDGNFLNGGAVAIYLEQPFYKDHFISVGFKANFIKFYYPSWPMFPTYDKIYFIPEVSFGFNI
jgi:hypothetical protein